MEELSHPLDEIFESVFHSEIEFVGKTITAASVAAYVYKSLVGAVGDKSPVSYSLESHLHLGFDRAVLFSREFNKELAQRLSLDDAFPIHSIKQSLHDKGLTRDDKLAKWGEIFRHVVGHLVVSTTLQSMFLVASAVRNAAVVLIQLQQDYEKRSEKKSVWRWWKKLRGGEGGALMQDVVLDLLTSALRTSENPFESDHATMGCGSLGHLKDAILRAVPQYVAEAQMVVEATVTSMGEGVDGTCTAETLELLLDICFKSFRGRVATWRTMQVMVTDDAFPAAITVSQQHSRSSSLPLQGTDGVIAGSQEWKDDGDGALTARRSSSRSPPMIPPREGDQDNIDDGDEVIELGGEPSPPRVLSDETRSRLMTYLADIFCASESFEVLVDSVVEHRCQRVTEGAVRGYEGTPQYLSGKRAMLLAVTFLDSVRLQVADTFVEEIPTCVRSFCEEMLKATCKGY